MIFKNILSIRNYIESRLPKWCQRPSQNDFEPGIRIGIENVPAKKQRIHEVFLTMPNNIHLA